MPQDGEQARRAEKVAARRRAINRLMIAPPPALTAEQQAALPPEQVWLNEMLRAMSDEERTAWAHRQLTKLRTLYADEPAILEVLCPDEGVPAPRAQGAEAARRRGLRPLWLALPAERQGKGPGRRQPDDHPWRAPLTPTPSAQPLPPCRLAALPPAEQRSQDIADLLTYGASYEEIASVLGITYHIVKKALADLYVDYAVSSAIGFAAAHRERCQQSGHQMSHLLVEAVHRHRGTPLQPRSPFRAALTARQQSIMELATEGREQGAIAEAMGLPLARVRAELLVIYKRLGARSLVDAVRIWLEQRESQAGRAAGGQATEREAA